jgi:peptide/nickel transport system substrate-binding protein
VSSTRVSSSRVSSTRVSGSTAASTAAALVALAACAALTACASGGPAPTSDDLVHAGRGRILTGGTLHWAVDAVPPTLNAYQPDATDATALVDSALLPTLFTLDAHARPTLDQDYLTGAELTSRQPQTVVYHLNPKAVWSTGAPLSAADFAAQWRALSGRDVAFTAAGTDGYDSISDVRQGATPRDVQVTFGKPYGPWKRLFSPLYPAAATSTAAAFEDGIRTALPADSGPFTFKSERPGALTVVRNPRWWGDRAKLDAIAFTAVAPGARADALRAGRLDVADVSGAVEDGDSTSATTPNAVAASAESRTYAVLQAVPGITLHRASAPAYLTLTLNGGSGPLADPRLRQAVAGAVDRQALADAVLTPLGLPAVPLGSHLLMADQDGYRDDSAALDSGAGNAAGLLDADGWKAPAGGAGARAKGGRPLSLRLLTRAGSALDAQVAGLLTTQLGRLGVPLVTQPVPADSFFTGHVDSGGFDLALFSWPGSPFPVAGELPLYAKPRVGADGTPVDGENLSGVGTDEIDQLLSAAQGETDPGAAARLAAEADTRIWQLAPSVPLFQHPQLVAVRDTVVNAGAFGFAAPRFADLGFTALPGTAANPPVRG